MPRNSAFKKASKAIAKTREFFSYESPFPTVVPADEACHGPCCAGNSSMPSSASTEAPAMSGRSAPIDSTDVSEPAKEHKISLLDMMSALEESEPEEGDSDESDSNESGSSDEDDKDNDKHAVRDDLCDCKTCLAARVAGLMHKCDPQEVAAYAAARKAEDGQDRAAAKMFPGWTDKKKWMAQNESQAEAAAMEDVDVAARLEELREQILVTKDLRDVIRWACEKITKVTVPLGDRALQQTIATLVMSAKGGSMARLMGDAAKFNAVQRATLPDQAVTEVTPLLGNQASQHMLGLQAALAEISVVEELMCEMLEGLKGQVQAFAGQFSQVVGVDARQEKILHLITKAPMSDKEYEEVSSRSLFFNGVLPDFSKNDVVQLLCRYGEVEISKVTFHSRNQETCWLGFFTMVSSKAADAARRDLHGKTIGAHALIVEKAPDARSMRTFLAQRKKNKAAKPTSDTGKDKEQKCAKIEFRLSPANKEYLAEKLQQLNRTEKDEVGEIISADLPAVKGVSKQKVTVDLDKLSDVVLLKLLAYFWKRFGCASGDSRSRTVSLPAVMQGQPKFVGETPALQSKTGKCCKQENLSERVIEDGENKRRQRAVTKWDLLRGLRSRAEEFLQIGTAMANEQFRRFNDPSVMNAPNMPTGAYTILRNDILAENIGRLPDQLHDPDDQNDLGQPKAIRAACRDPVARRWKALKRDFPDVATMTLYLQPERDEIRARVTSGCRFSSSCVYIVPGDAKSADAIARALGDTYVHGRDDLAAFTRRLAQIDKDARFRLEKLETGDIDPGEARCKELLDLGIKIIGRYPGLSRLISLETELPYHPSHEEGEFDAER